MKNLKEILGKEKGLLFYVKPQKAKKFLLYAKTEKTSQIAKSLFYCLFNFCAINSADLSQEDNSAETLVCIIVEF